MIKTIDECFSLIQNGANIKQGDVDGGFPITRIETITNDKFSRDRMGYAGITDISKYTSYLLEDGDLLMSHINSVQYLGRTVLYVKQSDETIIHGMNLLRLKARRDVINPAYAKYCFYGHPFRSQIRKITKKSVNQASFAVKDLKQIKLNIPALSEQNEIVMILDKIQQVLAHRIDELSKLDDLIKARFVEMFGNPLDGTAKYPIHQVGNVAEAVDPQPSHRTPPVQEGGVPYISIKDCDYKTGKIDFEGARKVARKVLEEHLNRYTLHDGDFVIGKIGTIGNPVFIPARDDYTLSANVVLVQPNCEVVSPYFLKYSFESDFVERQFSEAKNSTSQAAFGIQKVRNVKVMNPDLDTQRAFEKFVKQVNKSKVKVQKALDETQKLFDSLMQQYFG